MTLSPKFDRRTMLAADPKSFNELLDLFSTYVATVVPPIFAGCDMLREEIGAGEHIALGHIFGVACDAEDMGKRLQQIRAAREAMPSVNIAFARTDARLLCHALGEVASVLSDTETAFGVFERVINTDDDREELEMRALVSLTRRALVAAEDRDIPRLRCLVSMLQKAGAGSAQPEEEAQ